jgi:hypothetical protein
VFFLISCGAKWSCRWKPKATRHGSTIFKERLSICIVFRGQVCVFRTHHMMLHRKKWSYLSFYISIYYICIYIYPLISYILSYQFIR